MTSIDRTAYPGFARMVSARELADAFTPVGDEVVWAILLRAALPSGKALGR
ncbi:MAG: hypothetical protein ACXV5Q_14835 [Frankiaceae bacterium]